MSSHPDLKSRRDLMVKLRDDAFARGMTDLAMFYAAETIRLGAERINVVRERLRASLGKPKPPGSGTAR